MQTPARRIVSIVMRFLSRLRFRTLFLLSAALFAVDLFFPDAIPMVDELLLALSTLLLSQLKKPADQPPPPPPPPRAPTPPWPPAPRGLP